MIRKKLVKAFAMRLFLSSHSVLRVLPTALLERRSPYLPLKQRQSQRARTARQGALRGCGGRMGQSPKPNRNHPRSVPACQTTPSNASDPQKLTRSFKLLQAISSLKFGPTFQEQNYRYIQVFRASMIYCATCHLLALEPLRLLQEPIWRKGSLSKQAQSCVSSK